MVRTKVFVGNLSFKTREVELAQEFSSVAKVISANIITRGPRSLGYGFVELESEEEANKAVAAMDKKEIDGRQINVEVANIRQENEAAAEGAEKKPQGEGAVRGRGGFRGTRGTRGDRGGIRGGRGGIRGGRGGSRGGAVVTEGGNGSPVAVRGGAPKQTKPRPPRQPRAEGAPRENKPDTRVESQTSLFVANLPFSLTDETFGQVFSDNGLKFKTAHVVTKRNGRSKGFGFVEFDAHEDQQKALTTLNGKKIEERELVLRVALTDEASKANNAEAATETKEEAPAATEEKKN